VFGVTAAPAAAVPAAGAPAGEAQLRALGAQVYGANCLRCHGADGGGTAGLYPPLKGSPRVVSADFAAHVRVVLHGLEGEDIGGAKYAGKMPPFADLLSDEEIAAVVAHERSSWGNQAPVPSAADVKRIREE